MSHGIPRTREERTAQARERELVEIAEYRKLSDEVTQKMLAGEYSSETLALTSKLLARNPEYYTIWNYRRKIILNLPQKPIEEDLRFLFPLMKKYPKCYWIWNYRLWLLDQAKDNRSLWETELALVSKMLTLDNRNFHGWGYRRTVVAAIEKLDGKSYAQDEFDYATRMIKVNLSNFSAWHQRLILLPRVLDEQDASRETRKQRLQEELDLITQALYTDPDDQSLWFYHQGLVLSNLQGDGFAHLDATTKEELLLEQVEMIRDLMEDSDSKWLHEALVTYSGDAASLEKLRVLDPKRMGRWNANRVYPRP